MLNRRMQCADLRFWNVEEGVTEAKSGVASERIPLTAGPVGGEAAAFEGAFSPEFGLAKEDVLGFYRFEIPPDSVLSASTIPYEQVFSASEDRLRQWFGGKAVVVGNLRTDAKDRHTLPDGRIVSVCYAQAAAIDALLRKVFVRMPRVAGEWLLPLVGAVLGCVVGVLTCSWFLRRYLALAVLTAVFILASMAAYWRVQYLFNPLVPVFALLVAGELSAAVNRAVLSRRV